MNYINSRDFWECTDAIFHARQHDLRNFTEIQKQLFLVENNIKIERYISQLKKFIGGVLKDKLQIVNISSNIITVNRSIQIYPDEYRQAYIYIKFDESFNDELISFNKDEYAKFEIQINESETNILSYELISIEKDVSNCFIATVCFDGYDSPEVLILRKFRDEQLSTTLFGKQFIRFYYLTSPPVAVLISKSQHLKKIVKKYILEPIVNLLSQ